MFQVIKLNATAGEENGGTKEVGKTIQAHGIQVQYTLSSCYISYMMLKCVTILYGKMDNLLTNREMIS
jgi:hypothetical protein